MVDIIDSKWSELDASNTSAAPDGVQGGYAPSTIAPILRGTRGALKRFYNRINAAYTTTGSTTASVLTFSQGPVSYAKGERFAFWANATNTGAMTLNINALGAKNILRSDGTTLVSGDIASGQFTELVYDGTAFRVVIGAGAKYTGNVAAGTFTGNGAALTNLNASALTTGTVPNAVISGAYDGITNLTMNGILRNDGTGEAIRINCTNDTSSPYMTFWKPTTGQQGYIQHTVTTGAEGGMILHNTLPNTRINLRNTGGIDGLGYRVGSTNYTVWHNGNLTAADINGLYGYTPPNGANSVTAGNGLSGGGTIAATRTITLGTPGTITGSSTNSVSTTSHTHALTLVAGDINGALGYTAANGANSITAGNGLSGGGTIGATRTITLGTPGTITGNSTNSVSATSHTHSISLSASDVGAAPVGRSINAGNGMTGGGTLENAVTITMGTPGTITNSTTNSVSTSSHTHSLGFLAAEVHTGGTHSTTSLPIGHVIVLYKQNAEVGRNNEVNPCLSDNDTFYYRWSGQANAGAALSGTWRARGYIADGRHLAQRVA